STTQASTLYEHVRPIMSYLHELRDRIEKRGFNKADRLYLETCAAYASVQCSPRIYIRCPVWATFRVSRGSNHVRPLPSPNSAIRARHAVPSGAISRYR